MDEEQKTMTVSPKRTKGEKRFLEMEKESKEVKIESCVC